MKRSILIILLVIILSGLSGCCLSHEWVDATYTSPKTCAKCGKTDGEPLVAKAEDSIFYKFNNAYLEQDFINLLGEPDEIIENYNKNKSLKVYNYYDMDFLGVKGTLGIQFYKFHVFSLRFAWFTVDGKGYADKKQYTADLEKIEQFFDSLYECKDVIDRTTLVDTYWYNNFKDEIILLNSKNSYTKFVYSHED